MPANRPKERAQSDAKSARMHEVYRKLLCTSDLADQAIDDMRQRVVRLAQALCEHVWGKRFY